ncbi:hypothetical protein [Burkholderia ubonensis]|uniref:hypothetical protein n=1 Tax=Burkholderia ubonensis TaxID=101571 RepID=UPI0012FBFE5F|nr:hypothetical protein [Burkholderia ubonensis]
MQIVKKALCERAKLSACRLMIAGNNTFDGLPKMIFGNIETLSQKISAQCVNELVH